MQEGGEKEEKTHEIGNGLSPMSLSSEWWMAVGVETQLAWHQVDTRQADHWVEMNEKSALIVCDVMDNLYIFIITAMEWA